MARKVFFSFHYVKDNWRAAQIRNHWITKPDRKSAGYLDAASWEQLRRKGDQAIKRWINSQISGTSVTVVLIGSETYKRRWVRYEIERTNELQHGLIGIYMHRLKNQLGRTALKGSDPFYYFTQVVNGKIVSRMSEFVNTYDWVRDKGYINFARWVERAAKEVGK